MGIGFRIFLIDDGDCLRRISINAFDKLSQGRSEEGFPEFAGKRMRYALVAVETENRKPVAIQSIRYGILPIDDRGHLDRKEQMRQMQLAVTSVSDILPYPESKDTHVVDASAVFAKKILKNEYSWVPVPALEKTIIDAVLGVRPGR